MERLIKTFIKTGFVVVIVLLGLLIFGLLRAESILTTQLRSQIAENLGPKGIQVDFKDLKLDWQWPGIRVRLFKVGVFGTACSQIDLEEVSVLLRAIGDYTRPKDLIPDVTVLLKNPTVTCETGAGKNQDSVAPPLRGSVSIQQLSDLKIQQPLLNDIKVTATVENLSLELRKESRRTFAIRNFEGRVSLADLSSPVNISFAGAVKVDQPSVPFWIPTSVEASVNYEKGRLNIVKAEGSVLSLNSQLSGNVDLNKRELALLVKSEVPSLEKIPPPKYPGFPVVGWRGQVQSQVKVEGAFDNPSFEGFFKLTNSQLKVEVQAESLPADKSTERAAEGVVGAQVDVSFKGGAFFELKKFDVDLDLTSLYLAQGNLFVKPSGVPLILKTRGSFDRELKLESLFLKLSQLESEVSGKLDLSQSKTMMASLKFNLHPTTLEGLEKIFLPLSAHPLTGSVAARGHFDGDLKKPSQGKFEISDLALKNVKTQVHYSTRELLVDGPLALNLEGRMSADNFVVHSGKANLKADLTGLSLIYLNLFSKKQLEVLKISLSAEKTQGQFSLKSSQIETKAGLIEVAGQPPLALAAPMNLRLSSRLLSLTQLKTWLPSLQAMIPDGDLQFSVGLNGQLDPVSPMKSLLAVRGSVSGRLPKYLFVKSEPAVQVQTLAQKPKPPEAFFAEDNLLRNTQLAVDLIIDNFAMGELTANGIHIKSDLKAGQVQSDMNVQNVFGGSVMLPSVSLNLFQKDPVVRYELKTSKISIERLLNWAMPQYEKLIAGQVDLESVGTTKLPWAPDFTESILADGSFKIANGRLNTVELVEMFKSLSQKLPAGALRPDVLTSRGPLQAQLSGVYKIKDGQIALNPFTAITAQNDELTMKGLVDYALSMNMTGSAYIKTPLQGSFFDANKDGLGRLEIPFKIQGSPLKPEFKFADETISRMTAKVIEFEKKKLMQNINAKVDEKINGEIKSEIEKKKQQFTDDLKKKAQDLFEK